MKYISQENAPILEALEKMKKQLGRYFEILMG